MADMLTVKAEQDQQKTCQKRHGSDQLEAKFKVDGMPPCQLWVSMPSTALTSAALILPDRNALHLSVTKYSHYSAESVLCTSKTTALSAYTVDAQTTNLPVWTM